MPFNRFSTAGAFSSTSRAAVEVASVTDICPVAWQIRRGNGAAPVAVTAVLTMRCDRRRSPLPVASAAEDANRRRIVQLVRTLRALADIVSACVREQ